MPNGIPAESCEELRKQVSSCASWFFWIAAMTVINSLMIHSGSETSFMIGLTISMVMDAATAAAGSTAKIIAASFDAVCVAGLVFLGSKARRGLRWAFVVGIVLYGLDTLLSLVAPNVISIALHGWALFSMGLGLRAAGKLRVAEAAASVPPVLEAPVAAAEPITSQEPKPTGVPSTA